MLTLREQKVTVQRTNLLSILRTNRAKHALDYSSALDAWKDALTKETADLAKRTAKGDFKNIRIESEKPSHHLNNYDEVIEMLELSVDDNITLDKDSFRSFIKDEWHWKSSFTSTLTGNAGVLSKYVEL